MKHCCIKMEGALEEYGTPLHYLANKRSYCMDYGTVFKNTETGKDAAVVGELFKYCPWCGKQLPKSLWDEWYDEVETKFNIENTLDKEELKKLPKEYMTEEWWIKKGL